MFTFDYPFMLLFYMLFFLANRYAKAKEDALILPFFYVKKTKRKEYLEALKLLGIFCLVFALASPIYQKEIPSKKIPSHAILFAIDLSDSMTYSMQGGKKIDVAKNIASEFVKKRENDHIGIVAFGTFAYIVSPLTFDLKAISFILEKLKAGTSGKRTALLDTLFLSVRILKKEEAKEKIIILMTDGFDKGSRTPKEPILNALENENVKIYTIGIGDTHNSAFLEAIAKKSKGKFYRAKDKNALKIAYNSIQTAEKSTLKREKIIEKTYLYQYFLFFAILFFSLFLYLSLRRRG